MIIPPVPETVAHLVFKPIQEAKQLWLNFRVEWRHKSKFVSAVVHYLQAHLIHSAMTLFQPAPRSSSFSRSLVDSSCPNHQTPCWGTVERYKETSTQMHPCSFSLSLSFSLFHTHQNVQKQSRTLFHPFVQIIDPFVEVEIIGLPVDCCKEQTRVVDDNGKRNTAEKCQPVFHLFKGLRITACHALCSGRLFLYTNLTKS